MSGRAEKTLAILLLAMALAASAWLGTRHMELRAEIEDARAALEQAQNGAALGTLNNIALPANTRLRVCNDAQDRRQITALAAVYTDGRGALRVFNSGWHSWEVPAGAEQALQLKQAGMDWDGQALFYAMDIAGGPKEQMIAGTADDARNGCIALSGHRPAGKN